MALFQLAEVESTDCYYLLLDKVFKVYGTIDMRDSREESLVHALANAKGTMARVIETMRYGIVPNFSIGSVSKYLRDNEEMARGEKERILKFLLTFYNFEKRRHVMTVYELGKQGAGLKQLNKFMFVRLLTYL